jgi:hypothetical protein
MARNWNAFMIPRPGTLDRRKDVERPLQDGVLVCKATAFLHAMETFMARVNLVDPATATGATKPLL